MPGGKLPQYQRMLLAPERQHSLYLAIFATRNCRFCNVKKGRPPECDLHEPARVAEGCARLELKFVVITSVTRDDLPDGGAAIFAETNRLIKSQTPSCGVELLIPDLQGDLQALKVIIDSGPDVLAHNLETVPRLYKTVRSKAQYQRSLDVLNAAREMSAILSSNPVSWLGWARPRMRSFRLSATLKGMVVQIFTIGQYLRPSQLHLPVESFFPPEWFNMMKIKGEALGMKHIEAAPLVRSSYLAHKQVAGFRNKKK